MPPPIPHFQKKPLTRKEAEEIFTTRQMLNQTTGGLVSGGDPWNTDVSSEYTGSQAGKVLNDLKKIAKTNQALIISK